MKVPQKWLNLLTKLDDYLGVETAIIGGAIRDLYFGRKVKDLDIAVPYVVETDGFLGIPKHPTDILEDVLGSFTVKYVVKAFYTGMSDVDTVISVDEKEGYPELNFLMFPKGGPTDLLGYISRNDFGICQIGVTKDGAVVSTENFELDAKQRTFTHLRPEDVERGIERWNRLRVKYPEFEVVNL